MARRKMVTRGLLAVLFFLAIAVALAFMVLPVIAIFTHVPPTRLLHQFSNPIVTDALTETPTSPDAVMKIGIFGSITIGTGPT